MRQSSSTRLFAVLGDPVAHSLSPRFQNAGFLAAGIDAVYVALRCASEDLPGVVETLVKNGGGGNVTIPHKEAAAGLPGEADARVALLGVANTFGAIPDGLALRNTDVDGVLAALDQLEAPATAWCLLGTGGSARAVVGAARERGATLSIRSRSPHRAEAFAMWCHTLGVESVPSEECDVVINATPLGLSNIDPAPLDVRDFPRMTVALDLTYRQKGSTAWVGACRAAGLRAADGREMLVVQGAAAWQLWFPGVTPPMAVMRAALHGQLD